ncbi:MAG TPA: hypothetical protein VFI27_19750 [candidate division Zixibacteria bacterium]|nr:hypothetical protein [candidate division Zixibacteria bacterium]
MFFPVDDSYNLLGHWDPPGTEKLIVKKLNITPDEARKMIDGVLAKHGMDPAKAVDKDGWRRISLGDTNVVIGVIEWQPEEFHFVVFVPLLGLPPGETQLSDYFRALLILNHHDTLGARFSITGDTLFLNISRPIRGLDTQEVDDSIRSILVVADGMREKLWETLVAEVEDIPTPLDALPDVPLTPKEAQRLSVIFSACDEHGRLIFGDLMKRWFRAGFKIDVTPGAIGFKIPMVERFIGLAALRPGAGSQRQLCILGWESLRNTRSFSDAAVDQFQQTILTFAKPAITESSAHIEINDTFDINSARKLIKVLVVLAGQAQEPPPEQTIQLPLQINGLKLGSKTKQRISQTLNDCSPRIQEIFTFLISGWHTAGGTVLCNRPGSIYLKLTTAEHDFGEYGRLTNTFNLAVLSGPKRNQGPLITVAWDLARGEYPYLDYAAGAVDQFEKTVSSLPKFEKHGTVHRILLTTRYKSEAIDQLLQAMLALKAASQTNELN